LAQVYGIVKQHEGHIQVQSQPGQGTTFTIYLPLQVVKEEPAEAETQGIPRGSGQLVLLVEDQAQVLAAAQAMLEYLGYQVLTAVNGQQGLAQYIDHADQVDLVLADIVMPERDGLALFSDLKAHNPAVKVMLMTGYPLQSEEAQQLLAQGIVGWLQKPLSLTQLAQAISRALQTRSTGAVAE
jgi:CheY-like chemotaxis protein